MPKCIYCGKTGAFLKLSKAKLCSDCEKTIPSETIKNTYLYKNNLISLEDPATVDDLTTSITYIRRALGFLSNLQSKGLVGEIKNPKSLLEDIEKNHDNYYKRLFDYEYDELLKTIAQMQLKKYQLARIRKFSEHLFLDRDDLNDRSCMNYLDVKVQKLIEIYSR